MSRSSASTRLPHHGASARAMSQSGSESNISSSTRNARSGRGWKSWREGTTSSRDEGGNAVGGVRVERVARSAVALRRARVCMPRSVLHDVQGNASVARQRHHRASQRVRADLLRIAAAFASRRTIFHAACRSSRDPVRVVKIRPSGRSPIQSCKAAAVRGASGTVATLPPCRRRAASGVRAPIQGRLRRLRDLRAREAR